MTSRSEVTNTPRYHPAKDVTDATLTLCASFGRSMKTEIIPANQSLAYSGIEGFAVEIGAYEGIEIDATDLAILLNGIDLRSAKLRKRYSRIA